jgi:hypothetical protein
MSTVHNNARLYIILKYYKANEMYTQLSYELYKDHVFMQHSFMTKGILLNSS